MGDLLTTFTLLTEYHQAPETRFSEGCNARYPQVPIWEVVAMFIHNRIHLDVLSAIRTSELAGSDSPQTAFEEVGLHIVFVKLTHYLVPVASPHPPPGRSARLLGSARRTATPPRAFAPGSGSV